MRQARSIQNKPHQPPVVYSIPRFLTVRVRYVTLNSIGCLLDSYTLKLLSSTPQIRSIAKNCSTRKFFKIVYYHKISEHVALQVYYIDRSWDPRRERRRLEGRSGARCEMVPRYRSRPEGPSKSGRRRVDRDAIHSTWSTEDAEHASSRNRQRRGFRGVSGIAQSDCRDHCCNNSASPVS